MVVAISLPLGILLGLSLATARGTAQLATLAASSQAEQSTRAKRLTELAARCGSELDIQTEWDRAAAQARSEKKLIVVAVQAVGGFAVGDQIVRGPFMDLDVLHLLQERFVVLRWRKGMGAPFERQAVFGMGPSTFGSGLLVVSSEGDVVKQVFSLKATAVYDVLIETLGEHPKLSKPRSQGKATRQEQIEFMLQAGQLEQAQSLLASGDASESPVQEAILNADLQRLQRKGSEALACVERGLELLDGSAAEPDVTRSRLLLLRISLLTASGAPDQAEAILKPLLAAGGSSQVMSSALMLPAALRMQAGDYAAAQLALDRLVEDYPQTRWAWMAAAAMGGPVWALQIQPDLRWPKAEQRRLIRLPLPAENGSRGLDPKRMLSSAAQHLIASQQPDGSWITLTAYATRHEFGDDFELAATAIGGRALLRLGERDGSQQAARRALDWLFRRRELLEQLEAPPVAFMDYAVWSRSYGIFFLADCIEAGLGDELRVRHLMSAYLEDLGTRQQPNGGWSYYISGTAGGAALPQSISFTTATVLMALERAKQVDAAVDDDQLARGLDCLEAMRSPLDTFSYFLHGRSVEGGTQAATSIKGSAARGPACSLALVRGRREDGRDMARRMQLYVEHLPAFGAQRRKALMHAGLDTQGSHYLFFDYSTAAEALAEMGKKGLPRALRKRARAAILDELRASRNQDGSYVDNPLIGTDVATGLAINCLLDLGV